MVGILNRHNEQIFTKLLLKKASLENVLPSLRNNTEMFYLGMQCVSSSVSQPL